MLPASLTIYYSNKDSDEEDTEAQQKAKALILKQANVQQILRQILHHLIFVILLLFLCYAVQDSNHFHWNNHIKSVYTGNMVKQVATNLDMWQWLRNQVGFRAEV